MDELGFGIYLYSSYIKTFQLSILDSINKFGGMYSQAPVWVVIEEYDKSVENQIHEDPRYKNVNILYLSEYEDVPAFPFASYVYAASLIEQHALQKVEQLFWVDAKALILREPHDLILPSSKKLAYRPVHHKLIGSEYEKPLDNFWTFIYERYGISEEDVFPMQTHADEYVLRPYLNAGCLVVRPKEGLFQEWHQKFYQIYTDRDLMRVFSMNQIYNIFLHQAVLTGHVLSKYIQDDLIELPFEYNYPLHLYYDAPEGKRFDSIDEIVIARFEEKGDLESFDIAL